MNPQPCLIIGANGGIGSEVALQLAAKGHPLLLCGRSQLPLQALLTQLPGQANGHQAIAADITCPQGRAELLKQVEAENIGLVINLCGINQFKAFSRQEPEAIEQIIETNLTAVMLLTRDLINLFQKRGGGSLIHTGSALGAIGIPGYATYCASKFALRGFCEALARELASTPVRVRYFSPRATDTQINSDRVNDLNRELGNKTDSPTRVARELVSFIGNQSESYQIGWPEKLFVRLNGALPGLVGRQIRKQHATYEKYLT